MAHFTQLGLSGNPDRRPDGKPIRNTAGTNQPPFFFAKKLSRRQKTAAIVCSLMVTSLLAVFFLGTSGCSRKEPSKPTEMSQNQPVSPTSLAVPTESQPPAAQKAARKSAKRKSPTVTYTNHTYGLSFRYPRNFMLKTGDEAILHWSTSEPVPMDFVQPGGVAVAAIEPPRTSPRSSDSRGAQQDAGLTPAFFTVSVNSNLTSSQCTQFAFPKQVDAPVGPVSTAKVTVGTIEFDEMEDTTQQAGATYYHVFKNGACYEFALGQAMAEDAKEGVTPVGSKEVFGKLEKILSTVKIHEAAQAGASAAAPAGAPMPQTVVATPTPPADESNR
jgi:hypothetical protein